MYALIWLKVNLSIDAHVVSLVLGWPRAFFHLIPFLDFFLLSYTFVIVAAKPLLGLPI